MLDRKKITIARTNPVFAEGLAQLIGAEEQFDPRIVPLNVLFKEPGRSDVIFLDMGAVPKMVPHWNTQVRELAMKYPVLAYASPSATAGARNWIGMGFRGVVSYDSSFENVFAAIKAVAQGAILLDPAFVSALANETPANFVRSVSQLSERETSVLRLVAKGMTTKEIASAIDLSAKTVDTYKSRATKKLKLSSRAEIVSYAVENGWLLTA